MSDERRYDEEEVSAILERATSAEARAPAGSGAGTGMTLAELQQIGAEVGIPADQIAEAARSLERRPPVPAPRRFLGVPRSVSRIVPIGRALDDDEWTRLVVLLRETFGAEGRIRVHGQLRSWNNGNLQVHVEPDGDRWRVRMQTIRGDAVPRASVGVIATIMSAGLFLVNGVGGLQTGGMIAAGAIGLMGLGQLGFLRAQLPRWAAERSTQMEELAARIQRLLAD